MGAIDVWAQITTDRIARRPWMRVSGCRSRWGHFPCWTIRKRI